MSNEMIITIVSLGVVALSGIVAIVIAIVRGDMKRFIVEKMEEAEEKFKDLPKPQKSIQKLQYVLQAVKEKYKIVECIMNVKKFVEYIINIKNIGK